MNCLLATHAFLWYITANKKLSNAAQEAIRGVDSTVYLSAPSAWEIAIKYQIGRLPLPAPPDPYITEQMEKNGIEPLEITVVHALRVHQLPRHHDDPFDRLLVAQSLVNDLYVVSADPLIAKYPVRVIW